MIGYSNTIHRKKIFLLFDWQQYSFEIISKLFQKFRNILRNSGIKILMEYIEQVSWIIRDKDRIYLFFYRNVVVKRFLFYWNVGIGSMISMTINHKTDSWDFFWFSFIYYVIKFYDLNYEHSIFLSQNIGLSKPRIFFGRKAKRSKGFYVFIIKKFICNLTLVVFYITCFYSLHIITGTTSWL